jgi:WXG100 family type VII secretion target
MASGTVRVTFDEIEDAAAEVRAVSRAVQVELEDLYRMLVPLVATWSGDAAEEFQYQHQVWAQAAEDLNAVLSRIVVLLEDSHLAYSQAEASAASLWSE